jgi:phosphonate transport system substrate-binding protein
MIKKRLSKFFLTVGLVSTLAACGTDGSSASSSEKEWPEEITLVQKPNENNPNADSLHTLLREHLSKELGIEVNELKGSYSVGSEAMASGNLDVMLGSPLSYYQANKRAEVELLVSPQKPTDKQNNYTAFITQSHNTEINSIGDLKGTHFAFVNSDSSSGYFYPKGTLVQKFDLNPDLVEQSGYFFENVTFSKSHQNSLMGVKMRDFEAGAVAASVVDGMIASGTIKEGDIKEIGRTQDFPGASYMVRGDLPEDFKEALRDAFVSFENEEYFEALHQDPKARFVAVEQDYFDSSIEMLDAINALEE